MRPVDGFLIVQNAYSLVSAGTERGVVDFAGKSLLGKATSRPALVKQVLTKARKEGILNTIDAVRNRLDQPIALGYSCAGVVLEDQNGHYLGQKVACAGAGYASHAEVVAVPVNLMASVPDSVDLESAAFTTLGAIAMHGFRLSSANLGESVGIIGLGLVGLLAAQIAKAAGCRVVGIDLDESRVQLAVKLGIDLGISSAGCSMDETAAEVMSFTDGRGLDASLIAAATSSSAPVELAGLLARDRGAVVAIGDVGLEIPRPQYYGKELTFKVSRAYGPGRYDDNYEIKGGDYPIGYVRWTENRNMEAFLDLLANRKVDVQSLVTHKFSISEAASAYDLISGNSDEESLGILLEYPDSPNLTRRIELDDRTPTKSTPQESCVVGLIGAGAFATGTLLPAMREVPGIQLHGVCTASGLNARHVAEQFGFQYCTTDPSEVFNDEKINTSVILTRHNLHAALTIESLKAGKNVFCEKPLTLTEEDLKSVVQTYWNVSKEKALLLMVGFNRRFSPLARKLKEFFQPIGEPKFIQYRVNAGYLDSGHWVQDFEQGGGRILGEVCHFVDFLIFLTGCLPHRVFASALPNSGKYAQDNLSVCLTFSDGSVGNISFLANGDSAVPKERIEVFGGGRTGVLNDFRNLECYKAGSRTVVRSRFRQDKGHKAEWEAFVSALKNGDDSPTPLREVISTTMTTIRILDSIRAGQVMDTDIQEFMNLGSAGIAGEGVN